MTEKELGMHIDNFVKLNPKQNKIPNINKYSQKSFFIIQNSFKENKKNIITGLLPTCTCGGNNEIEWVQ